MTRLPARWPLLLALCWLALTGCAANDHQQCGKQGLSRLVVLTEVNEVFEELASGFCPAPCSAPAGQSCDEPGLSKLVLVPDFVNITNYAPGTSGLYMGEQMRAALSQRCHSRIYQAEFGRDLKLSAEGLVSLTREPGEVANEAFAGQDILIGTYAYSGNRLSLFVRKISGANGVIGKMMAKEIEFKCGSLGTKALIIK